MISGIKDENGDEIKRKVGLVKGVNYFKKSNEKRCNCCSIVPIIFLEKRSLVK
jgi:hypothetical protein